MNRPDAPRYMFAAIATLTVMFLGGIFVFLFSIGIGTFNSVSVSQFLFGTVWNPTSYGTPSWGIAALLAGTLMVSAAALAFAVPLGLSAAIYLSELASKNTKELLKPLVEMISSIPSVVLGLLGIIFFAPFIARIFNISNGLNALTASLLVAITALPTIASICEDALLGVSKRYRDASFALGASRWETIRKVVLPAAKTGILAGILLGFARIIGETMIVLMVAGNSIAFPRSFLDPVRPLTANIAIEIKEVVVGSIHWQALFALGLILFLLTFVLNLIADSIVRKTHTV
jgi:phosphate transport system permease protein